MNQGKTEVKIVLDRIDELESRLYITLNLKFNRLSYDIQSTLAGIDRALHRAEYAAVERRYYGSSSSEGEYGMSRSELSRYLLRNESQQMRGRSPHLKSRNSRNKSDRWWAAGTTPPSDRSPRGTPHDVPVQLAKQATLERNGEGETSTYHEVRVTETRDIPSITGEPCNSKNACPRWPSPEDQLRKEWHPKLRSQPANASNQLPRAVETASVQPMGINEAVRKAMQDDGCVQRIQSIAPGKCEEELLSSSGASTGLIGFCQQFSISFMSSSVESQEHTDDLQSRIDKSRPSKDGPDGLFQNRTIGDASSQQAYAPRNDDMQPAGDETYKTR